MGHSIRLTRIAARANQIAAQLQELHFPSYSLPVEAWQPAVNVYAYADRFEVCVDLAGVPKQEIELVVDARRLLIRGCRQSPESRSGLPPCGRILMMEIPEGNFERALDFPVELAPEHCEARQENGWLWITLPRTWKEDHE
jgi:HSP20 family protein